MQLEKRGGHGSAGAAALRHESVALASAHLDATGHAEVKARPGTAVELEPEMLAVAVGRDDAAPEERSPDASWAHPLEHDRIRRAANGDDSPPDGSAREPASGGLDLGQLGHRASVR